MTQTSQARAAYPRYTGKKVEPRHISREGGRAKKSNRRTSSSRQSMRGKAEKSNAKFERADANVQAIFSKKLTYALLIPTIALVFFGLVMVFSAGSVVGMNMNLGSYRFFLQQLACAVLGALLMILFAHFDYHKLGKLSWIGLILSIGLLVAVIPMGRAAGGAQRWIMFGSFNLQPTEIAKFALIVFAAYSLSRKGNNIKEFIHLIVPVILVLVIEAILIMLQPDMGSTLVIAFTVALMIFVAGASFKHLLFLGIAGGGISFGLMLAAPYRRARLFSFIDPWKNPKGYGYQVIQSYIAMGTGHIKGLGLGMSRQKFLYLPNAHTDFIFAIIGEELGLIGTITVVILVGMLGYAGFLIARKAPDNFGRLLAAGITGLIVIQALVNMGGVTGLLPITGVPLPFASFGGSSLCVCMCSIGILLNITKQCT
ncbi:MAG: putative lipid II flippase FtsW [Actinomycetota bacterium]|nr:putative lipid II flippase FtsW [Actinomycetota bacterium]